MQLGGGPEYLLVDTFVELAPEELDPHDGEDEPEDEAHQQHVEDGGDGVHQRVHHNLNMCRLENIMLHKESFS